MGSYLSFVCKIAYHLAMTFINPKYYHNDFGHILSAEFPHFYTKINPARKRMASSETEALLETFNNTADFSVFSNPHKYLRDVMSGKEPVEKIEPSDIDSGIDSYMDIEGTEII